MLSIRKCTAEEKRRTMMMDTAAELRLCVNDLHSALHSGIYRAELAR